MAHLTESDIEAAALAWLESLCYQILFGPDIAPGMPAAERENYLSILQVLKQLI